MTFTYQTAGNPNGDILIFLSGWPDNSKDNFEKQIPSLSDKYSLFLCDLPGFERDNDCARQRVGWFGYSLHELADMFKSTIDEIVEKHVGGGSSSGTKGNRNVFVMCHDWGASVTATTLRKYPELKVQKVVFLDIAPQMDPPTPTAALIILWYQSTLACLFFLLEVVLFFLPQFVRDLPTKVLAKLFTAPSWNTATMRQGYMYFRFWVSLFGSIAGLAKDPAWYSKNRKTDGFSEYDQKSILFFWGTKKPFFFHSKRFIEYCNEKGKKDGCSGAIPIEGGHWFFRSPKFDNEKLKEFFAKQ